MKGIYCSRLSPYPISINNFLRYQHKLGKALCMPERVKSEASETLCLDPEYYLDNMMFWLVEDEGQAETIIHRDLDEQGLRCKPGARKEIFYDVTPEMIDIVLTRNGISYTKCSYREYERLHNLLTRILNEEVQDKKIVQGNLESKKPGEVERCKILAGKNLCVKEIVKKTPKTHRLYPQAKFSYVKGQKNKTYGMADFRWDILHGYLTIEKD